MDDLKKQRIKRINRVVDKVSGDFEQGLVRQQLDKLYDRKSELIKKIANTRLNLEIAKQQMLDVEDSISLLEKKVDLNRDIDLSVDEDSAKQFIMDNPDVFPDADQMVKQNDALDKLEQELYGKKK